jgi:GDP/UDP-N,N'-diacetylbacillosamine 2-epimerase (hydrolysing)
MTDSRHICFFTGKRGGFTHLIPIIEKISETEGLKHSIIAADMHLSETFGRTIEEVKKWADNVYTIDTMLESESKTARAKSIGLGIINYSQLLDDIRPDCVFVLGDRGEVLALVIAALQLNIPIIHLFGGDICQGGVDEPTRHAITKLANIHLTSNEQSAERILKMGEEPWRVHTVGSPVLDLIRKKNFTPADEIYHKFRLSLGNPILLLLQHSVTWQVEAAEAQIRETMGAIDEMQFQTLAVYPCADPGYGAIIKVLSEYRGKPYFQLYPNVEFSDFWGLMNVATAFIGNSSAGLLETPSFKLPFVNVGIRQQGRLRADNVIDVDHDRNAIIRAVSGCIDDHSFRERLQRCKTPYGDGYASDRIVSIIAELKFDDNLIRKKMTL